MNTQGNICDAKTGKPLVSLAPGVQPPAEALKAALIELQRHKPHLAQVGISNPRFVVRDDDGKTVLQLKFRRPPKARTTPVSTTAAEAPVAANDRETWITAVREIVTKALEASGHQGDRDKAIAVGLAHLVSLHKGEARRPTATPTANL